MVQRLARLKCGSSSCLLARSIVWSVDCRWSFRTFDSHPKEPGKRRRGCGSPQKHSPKALERRRTPHPRRSVRARAGAEWRSWARILAATRYGTKRKGLRPRPAWGGTTKTTLGAGDGGSGRRAVPTRRREWLKFCTMWRGTSRSGRPQAQRPPHEPPARERRRDPCEVPIPFVPRSRKRHLISTARAAAVDCRTAWVAVVSATAL